MTIPKVLSAGVLAGFCGGLIGGLFTAKYEISKATGRAAMIPPILSGAKPLPAVPRTLHEGGAVPSVLSSCSEELHKFCADIVPGHGNFKKCLLSYKEELNEKCRKTAAELKTPGAH